MTVKVAFMPSVHLRIKAHQYIHAVDAVGRVSERLKANPPRTQNGAGLGTLFLTFKTEAYDVFQHAHTTQELCVCPRETMLSSHIFDRKPPHKDLSSD